MKAESIEKGWRKGLAVIQLARQRDRKEPAAPGKPGRPKSRRMQHQALHEAMAGLARA